MPDYETLYPGRFLKKEALPAPKHIRIISVACTELESDKGGTESKAVVKYKAADGEGEIVFCKTNSALTAVVLGTRDYAQWSGKVITIHHDPSVMFGGKKVGGVRVCGGPEMVKPQTVEIKMPRKKRPDVYHLAPTGKKKAEPAPTPAPAPVPVGVIGEDIDPPISEDIPA